MNFKFDFSTDDSCLCGLQATCKSPFMPIQGEGKEKIFILKGKISPIEDKNKKLFDDREGKFFISVLKSLGVNLDRDCWSCATVRCSTDKELSAADVNTCKSYAMDQIKELKPKLVITLGANALTAVLSSKLNEVSFYKWKSNPYPDFELNTTIFPTINLKFLHFDTQKLHMHLFKKDIYNALNLNTTLPKPSYYDSFLSQVKIVDGIKELKRIIYTKPIIAIDIESTGLKPFKDGHEIICISISDQDSTVVFKVTPDVIPLLKMVLEDEEIKKIAHHLQFEHRWFSKILEVETKGWYWDTMVTAHILDGRTGITGLKFQAMQKFGIFNYNESVDKFLKGTGGSHSFNNIKSCNMDELMKYCGLDTRITYELYKLQKKELDNELNRC